MKNMAKKLFVAAMCLSMSVTAVPAVTGTTQTVSAEQTTAKNGLYHEGNAWNYYTDGAINKANTIVKYNGQSKVLPMMVKCGLMIKEYINSIMTLV